MHTHTHYIHSFSLSHTHTHTCTHTHTHTQTQTHTETTHSISNTHTYTHTLYIGDQYFFTSWNMISLHPKQLLNSFIFERVWTSANVSERVRTRASYRESFKVHHQFPASDVINYLQVTYCFTDNCIEKNISFSNPIYKQIKNKAEFFDKPNSCFRCSVISRYWTIIAFELSSIDGSFINDVKYLEGEN